MMWEVEVHYRDGAFRGTHTVMVPGGLAGTPAEAEEIALDEAALAVDWDEVLKVLVRESEE